MSRRLALSSATVPPTGEKNCLGKYRKRSDITVISVPEAIVVLLSQGALAKCSEDRLVEKQT